MSISQPESRLDELNEPTGWLYYGGVTTNPLAGIPTGYEMAWDPQLMGPETVATQATTWGKVRGLFRLRVAPGRISDRK